MKKKILIITSILLIITVILSINLYNKSLKNNKVIETKVEEDTNDESSGLAILVEDSDGNYQSSDTFPTEGYEFNSELSRCAYGGTVSWRDGKVFFSTSGSDMCYVYFSQIKGENFAEYIKGLYTGQKTQLGDGYLYYHDKAGTLENGAQDDSYRYTGNNPDNFVCFGSEVSPCPEENMYRIIGIFPFNVEGEQQTGYTDGMEYKVKLVKSEYITAEELGITANSTSLSVNSSYTGITRIKTQSSINGFYWNSTQASGKNYNDWETATLNKALNDTSTGYLSKLETKWTNKIATSTWYVSGRADSNVTAKQMRTDEMASSLQVKAKVGLMYANDYGFAASEDSWTKNLYDYDNDTSRKANWLFNGVNEWLFSPRSSRSDRAFYVYRTGYVDDDDSGGYVNLGAYGVRPSFYLESSTMISSDGNDGSHEHPYRLT